MSIIEVKNLCKSFNGVEVLKNVNLTVEEGERIVIIGGSGCGKSVFLRCIELLEVPDNGQIFINSQEITAPNANIDKIRQSMGMVYQRFHLFTHLNIIDNLTLAPIKLLNMSKSDAEEKAIEWLEKVGLIAKKFAYPEELSGGQQQRIAICRSLMMNPKVLLFDEPTSALDPTMVGEVLAVIRMLTKQKLTMIIVTHEMNFAKEVASRILFFAERGIYEQGTPQEIFDNPKRPLTVAFINKHKYFYYEIDNKKFDLMKFQGNIWTFSEKYGISSKISQNLQLCCEEIIFEIFDGCYTTDDVDIIIKIIFIESSKSIEIEFIYGGKEYNPFNKVFVNEFDFVSIAILKNISEVISYSFDNGKNTLKVKLSKTKKA